MPFAPHEIESKKFIVALRGYARDEVDAFLRAIADDYRTVLADTREPAEWLAEMLERILRSARDAADASRRKAEADADEIRRSAHAEAAELRQAAAREAGELRAAADREAEACFGEIARRADELHGIETRLQQQLSSMEVAMALAKSGLEPLGADSGAARLSRAAHNQPPEAALPGQPTDASAQSARAD